jgi:hypothetical protein
MLNIHIVHFTHNYVCLLIYTLADCRSKCRKSIVMSVGVSTCLAEISLECGVATWDGTGVFDFIISAKASTLPFKGPPGPTTDHNNYDDAW